MEKSWSSAEIAYLKKHAESHSLEQLAEHFNTDVETIRQQLAEPSMVSSTNEDPALGDYDDALKHMHGGDWKKAAGLFEKIVERADSLQITDRARQNLAICRQHFDEESDTADPYLEAVFAKNQGDLDAAREICEKHGQASKDERFAYLAASVEALAGAEDEAVVHLETAIQLEPKNRVHAFHDPDFRSLHGNEAFTELISVSSPSS